MEEDETDTVHETTTVSGHYLKLNIFQSCAGDLNKAKEVYAWVIE